MAELPERDMKDFNFRQLLRVRVTPSSDNLQHERCSLLAVSNKHGLTFIGVAGGFVVLQTSVLTKKAAEVEKVSQTVVEDCPFWANIRTPSSPSHVGLSSDDLTLAVCVKRGNEVFAQMYDVRAFAAENSNPSSFLDVKLSSGQNQTLADFAWNPGADYPSLFASVMCDGSVQILDVKENLTVMASLQADTEATCLCWSPRGKQVVVGKKSGELTQYDQALTPKKQIPCPEVFQGTAMSVLDVLWQSTQVFIAAYVPSGASAEQPQVVITSLTKGGPITCVNMEDLCYGSGEERQQKYYFLQLPAWEIAVASSANALEAIILGKHPENKVVWERWSLDDSGRAEMPMTTDFNETYPMGMAIDTTSQTPISLGDNLSHPASPIFMLLSTDGILVVFHMMNSQAGASSVNTAPQPLTSQGARASKGLAQAGLSGMGPPATIAPAPAKPSIFGNLATSTPKPATSTTGGAGFEFGKLSTPGMSFITPLSTSTPAPVSFGSLAKKDSSVLPSFGGLAKQTEQKPVSTFGSLSGDSTKATAASTLTFGGASTAPKAGNGDAKPTTLGFGGLPARENKAPGTAATVGSLGAGQAMGKPVVAAQPTGVQADKPASGFGFAQATSIQPSITKPTGFSAPASSVQSGVTPSTVATTKPLPTPVAPKQPPVTTSAAPASRPQVAQKRELSSSTTTTTTTRSDPRTATPADRKSFSDADNPFTKSIIDEMAHFERELAEVRSRSAGICINIGTREEMMKLRQNTESMYKFCEDIRETTKSVHSDITNLKQDTLAGFALLEECQAREQRNHDDRYHQLLAARALDPLSARKMKEIRSHFHYIDNSIRQIDLKLDAQWEEYQANTKRTRKMQTPLSDAIYTTVSNNHNVITNQARLLERLTTDLQALKIKGESSQRPDSGGMPLRLRDLDNGEYNETLGASFAAVTSFTASPSPKKPSRRLSQGLASSPISPEKNAKMRDILSKRRVTPVKSTAPGNLSMSKIVAADVLRRTLAEELDDTQDTIQPPITTPPRATPDRVVAPVQQPRSPLSVKPAVKSPVKKTPTPVPEARKSPAATTAPSFGGNIIIGQSKQSPAPSPVLSTKITTSKIAVPTPIAAVTTAAPSPGFGLIKNVPATTSSFKLGGTGSLTSGTSGTASSPFGNLGLTTKQAPPVALSTTPLASTKPVVSTKPPDISKAAPASAFTFGGEKPTGQYAPVVEDVTPPSTPPIVPKSGLNLTSTSKSEKEPGATVIPSTGFAFGSSALPAATKTSMFGSLTKGTPATTGFSFGGMGTPKTASASAGFTFGTTTAAPKTTVETPVVAQVEKPQVSTTTLAAVSKPVTVSSAAADVEADANSSSAAPTLAGLLLSSTPAQAGSPGMAGFSFGSTNTVATTAGFSFASPQITSAPTTKPSAPVSAGFRFPATTTATASVIAAPVSKSIANTEEGSVVATAITPTSVAEQKVKADPDAADKPTPNSTPGIFGKKAATTSATGTTSFGQVATTAPPPASVFGQPASTSLPTTSVFGKLSISTPGSPSVFGGQPGSAFGSQPTTVPAVHLSQSQATPSTASTQRTAESTTGTITTTTASAISTVPTNQTQTTTLTPAAEAPMLSSLLSGDSSQAPKKTAVASPAVLATPLFGSAATTSDTATSSSAAFSTFSFASPSAASPALPTATTSASAPTSGTTTGAGLFGGGGGGGFGTAAATTSASTGFGFGSGSVFAQTPTSGSGGFGSSVFGQSSAFGAQSTSSGLFGATTTTTSSSGFGGGGGGIFSGLGGKPSEEKANTNVFGGTSVFGGGASSSPGLFGGGGGNTTGFASPSTSNPGAFGGGSFSSNASVAASGFGGFGQQPQSQPQPQGAGLFGSSGPASGFGSAATSNAGGFGGTGGFATSASVASSGFGGFGQQPAQSQSVFGGAPAFGSPPAFGGAPAFGSASTGFGGAAAFSSPVNTGVFGQSSAASDGGGFSSFANTASPTFGALAQQTGGPSFGAIAQQQQQQQPIASPGFGGSGFGGGGFGGGFGSPTPGFGGGAAASPASPVTSPSFTSYRS